MNRRDLELLEALKAGEDDLVDDEEWDDEDDEDDDPSVTPVPVVRTTRAPREERPVPLHMTTNADLDREQR